MDRKVERTGEGKGVGEATWFYDFMFFGEWQGEYFSWGGFGRHLCYSVHQHGESFKQEGHIPPGRIF